MYTAIVLKDEDRNRLLETLQSLPADWKIPTDWEILAYHMTVNMGAAENGPAADKVGNEVMLMAQTYAIDDKVCAVGVKTEIPSTNPIKHITIAVNRSNGGKPVMSSKLTNWNRIKSIILQGVVREV